VKTVHLTLNHHTAKLIYYDRETQTLRPDLVFVDPAGSIVFETNEIGLKGDAVDDRRRLAVVWGDSVVFGTGRGWPCLIDALAPGHQFLNGGIEGDSYANILRRAEELNRQRRVALNLVMLGWHPLPDNRNVRAALDAFLRQRPNTVLLTIPTALNRRIAGQDLSPCFTGGDPESAFSFAGNLPYSRDLQQTAFDYLLSRNEIVRDCAQRTGTPMVDLFAEFDTEPLGDFRQDFLDIMHLRPSAYPKVARAIYHGIENVLAPSPMPVS
jgi:lysophospholipase L1-like esterase